MSFGFANADTGECVGEGLWIKIPSSLIVEDDEARWQELCQALEPAGYQTACARSGPAALGLAGERPFDLALVDADLADGSGLEVCRQIKSAQPVFVVLLTGPRQPPDGLEPCVDDFIRRPISAQELRAHVGAYLRLQRTQASLRASEASYRQLFESMIDGYGSVDLEGRFLDFNQALLNMLGYTAEELRQLTYFDITPEKWRAEEAKIVEDQILPRGYSDVYEKEYQRKDGTVFPVELHTVLLHDQAGNPQATWAIIRDITERKQAEEETLLKNKQLSMLNQLGQALNRLAPLPEILERISDLIDQVFDNHNLYIALYDEVTNVVSFPVYWMGGERNDFLEGRPLSNGLTEFVIHARAPVLISEHVEQTLAERGVALIGTICQCYLGVPILLDGRVLGVIAVQDYQRANVYTANHVELLSTIASQAAIAIQNARLYEKLQQELAERKQAEEALRLERDRTQQILDTAEVILIMLDSQGKITLINRPGSRILGYTESELKGEDWITTCIPICLREQIRIVFRQYMAGEIETEYYENPVLTKAGEERTVAWHNTLLRDEQGKITGVLSAGMDITGRKNAEALLCESEARYHSLFENASLGIFHSLPEERFLQVNPALASMLGYDSPAEMATTVTDIRTQLSANPDRFNQTVATVTGQAGWLHMENQYRRKDGRLITGSLAVRQVLNPDGTLAYLEGFVEDITQRRQIENELRLDEQRLEGLLEISQHQAESIDELLAFAVRQAIELTGSRFGYLFSYDEHRQEFNLEYSLAGSDGRMRHSLPKVGLPPGRDRPVGRAHPPAPAGAGQRLPGSQPAETGTAGRARPYRKISQHPHFLPGADRGRPGGGQ